MKVVFCNAAPCADLDEPICVSSMMAIPREGETVTIDLTVWEVTDVPHFILPNDEPHVTVMLRAKDHE